MKKILALVLLTGAVPPSERVVEAGATVAVTVGGVPARLSVEPGVPGLPLVNQTIVDAAKLECSGFFCFGVGYAIGRERVAGKTAVVPVGWDGAVPDKQRVGWLPPERPLPGDGTVGPGGLPEPIVRFVLGPSRPGERTVALPMERRGLFGDWGPLRAELTVGTDKIAVRFDPRHPRSLVTAAAGVAIAQAQGGVLTGEPGRQEILFGIERPYRVMTLTRPLVVGPLALPSLGVRTTDGAGANTIPQEGDDPSEVVVNAKGKKTYRVLSLGADVLARCSSLVFDKPAKVIRLTC